MINSRHNFKVTCFSPFHGVSRNFDRRDRKEGEKIGRRKIEEEWGGKIASPLFRLVFFNVCLNAAASIPGLNERPSHGLTRLTDA